MDTSSTIKRLLGENERIRTENLREGQRREREIRQGFPALAALLDERRNKLTESIRMALQRHTADTAGLQDKMRALNEKIRTELLKAGYPENYLQPIYRCPICRDTGYVGEPVHELCACMKQRLMDAENAGERKGGLGNHSFGQFDLNVFPDTPISGEKRSQRDHMRLILRAAQRYAEDFPDNEKPNLIFFGAAGLGKTFVADCIAQRIMERSYLVRRVTAYRLCEIMRKNQFDGSEARAVEGMMDVSRTTAIRFYGADLRLRK